MEQNKRSKTAEVVAAARAWHLLNYQYHFTSPVFEDAYAIQLTSNLWRTIIKTPILGWLVMEKALQVFHPGGCEMLGRARWAKEKLEAAVNKGIDQYVILGAGLDSFALRREDLGSSLKVYEIDHPASQQAKWSRLAKLNIDLPNNIELVSINFEKESVAEALARSSYSAERPAFFSWLGVTYYLTRKAVFSTLNSIASYAKPGSEIVLDYIVSKELLDPTVLKMREKEERFVTRLGEPLIASFDPITFIKDVYNLKFELIEQLPPEEQQERYFSNIKDELRTKPDAYFSHFRLRK